MFRRRIFLYGPADWDTGNRVVKEFTPKGWARVLEDIQAGRISPLHSDTRVVKRWVFGSKEISGP